jgi:hypothetical protein
VRDIFDHISDLHSRQSCGATLEQTHDDITVFRVAPNLPTQVVARILAGIAALFELQACDLFGCAKARDAIWEFSGDGPQGVVQFLCSAVFAGAICFQGPFELGANRRKIQFGQFDIVPCQKDLILCDQIARRAREGEAGQEYSDERCDSESVLHATTMTREVIQKQVGFLMLEDFKTNLMLVRSLLTRPKRVVLNADATRTISSESWLDQVRAARNESDLEPARFEVPHDQLEARAFWINLYNALTLQAMVHTKIQKSVLEFPGFFDCCAYRVYAGSLEFTLTLSEIEHGVLRGNRAVLFSAPFAPNDPRLDLILPLEPRIHFALNCGAISCPPICAYQAENVEAQLEIATRSYLQSVRLEHGVVIVPRLLQWYAKDFGNPLEFIRTYHPELPANARVRFDAYNWKTS